MTVDPQELESALDKGSGGALPPNHPQGLFGEVGLNLAKSDDWTPDGSAGLSQESDGGVVLLAVLLSYLLFFPLGFWILWRTKRLDRRRKVGLAVLMAAGVVAVGVAFLR